MLRGSKKPADIGGGAQLWYMLTNYWICRITTGHGMGVI
jgi:hypothetical protein